MWLPICDVPDYLYVRSIVGAKFRLATGCWNSNIEAHNNDGDKWYSFWILLGCVISKMLQHEKGGNSEGANDLLLALVLTLDS